MTVHNSFDFALNSHIYENNSHKILFENTSLVSNGLGNKQVVREANETIKNDFTNYIKKPTANTDKPVTKNLLGYLLKSKISIKTCS